MTEHTPEAQHFRLNWQQQLAEAFSTIAALCRYLQLSPSDLPVSAEAVRNFPLKVPLSFAASMAKRNPHDPLLRQVLPVDEEMLSYRGFNDDPVGDLQSAAVAGVLHKYQGRVLFINTGSCAINCRYCFRRNFPYSELQIGKQQQNSAVQYIKDNDSVSEVILSGGDPLVLSDARLKEFILQLNTIGHLKRIRIHSRLPVVLPARITAGFIETLSVSSKKMILVVHCNHANEVSDRVVAAFSMIKKSGIELFNQSVLLKGVNDNAEVLCALSETLFGHGVVPYYLHLLDKAAGTGHFEVTEPDALALMKEIQAKLPGYLVPKLVRERAGGSSKEHLIG